MRLAALLWCGVIWLALSWSSTQAASRDDFPSCYSMLDRPELASRPANRELFVIVDQTVPMDVSLKRRVHRKVHRFVEPGDRVTLLTFSAAARNRYAAMPLTGQLDYPLDEDTRYRTSIPTLEKFDHCMKEQRRYVAREIDDELKNALNGASADLPKTELAGSLARFGKTLIQRADAEHVDVLIVSDMLENSETASFYHNGRIEPIDTTATLDQLDKAGLLSDWGDARVYVIGAGLLPNTRYRSEKTLQSLERFWRAYFKQSNAELAGWGQPDLMVELE